MTERISQSRLYSKLMNHNAWTNGPILDIDSLGAGGSRYHLIIANTQQKIGNLMTNSQLWDLIDSIGNYERSANLQRNEKPIQVFYDEMTRLDNGGKYNYYIIKDLFKSKGIGFGDPVQGRSFEN